MCSKQQFGRFRRAACGLTLVFTLLPLVACGKKGDPMPPLRTIPLPTSDLSVRQQGRLILFDLSYPNVTVSGMALDGIDALELHAMTKPLPPNAAPGTPWPSAEPAEFVAAGKLLQRFSGADLQAAVAGDRLQFQLPLASPLPATPTATIYAVRSVKGTEISGYSNRVSLVAREPVAPPRNLTAAAQGDGIHLGWESDDSQGFDIFRRDAQSKAYGQAIARVPGSERAFIDRSAAFGNRYIYTVRAVANANPLVHSDPAGEREIEFEDRYGPAAPEKLIGLGDRGEVRLRWQPNTESDLKGYLVFRKDPNRDFIKVTPEPIAKSEWNDRGLASGLTFEYVVVAVDRSGNESPRSAVISVVTR